MVAPLSAGSTKDINVVCEIQTESIDARKPSSVQKVGLSIELTGGKGKLLGLACKANYGTTTFDSCDVHDDSVSAFYKLKGRQINLTYNIKSKSISVFDLYEPLQDLKQSTGVCK